LLFIAGREENRRDAARMRAYVDDMHEKVESALQEAEESQSSASALSDEIEDIKSRLDELEPDE
jgi:hypothetical protein